MRRAPQLPALHREPKRDHLSQVGIGCDQVGHELDVLVVRAQVVEEISATPAPVQLVDVPLQVLDNHFVAQSGGIKRGLRSRGDADLHGADAQTLRPYLEVTTETLKLAQGVQLSLVGDRNPNDLVSLVAGRLRVGR